jgi:hypothetical protein
MYVVIAYESMFGSTRAIAEAIAEGFGTGVNIRVLGVVDADAQALESSDLVVVGGPTHAWGMSRRTTRAGAPNCLRKPGRDLVLELGANTGPGVRDWLSSLGELHLPRRRFRYSNQGSRCAHRSSVERHRSLARTPWTVGACVTGELPRQQREPSAAGRDGAGALLGCPTGDVRFGA